MSFYYCYAEDGTTLDCIVAEITNTPWHERHSYVLPVATAERHRSAFAWGFRQGVSRLALHADGTRLRLALHGAGRLHCACKWTCCVRQAREFDATLVLDRRALNRGEAGTGAVALSR